MSSLLNPVSPTTQIEPFDAAQTLGVLLKETPEYKAFIQAQKALNSDPISHELSLEYLKHLDASRKDQDLDGTHAAELTRLELEMEDLPVIQEYRQSAREIRDLLQAVDKIISQEAGLDFAINAQHGGCACGG